MKHKIAVAQINPTLGDLPGNGRKIIEYIERARQMSADIVIFPEQVVTGYPAQDLLLHEDFVRDTMFVNERIVENTKGITAIIGTIEQTPRGPNGKTLHNIAIVAKDGAIIGKQAKTLLPTYDVFSEQRYFTPAENAEPIEIDGVKFGIQICEDMWDELYTRKITKELVKKGAKAIINLSASPWTIGKKQTRYDLIREHARANAVPFIYANMVGGQDELIFDGASLAVNQKGELCAEFPQFKEQLAVIDFSKTKTLEKMVREEELFKGLTLGLRDFFHKNNLTKAILGLSGGIDSAVTAIIAAEALGPQNVKALALPSQYSTPNAYKDAKELAERLKIDFDIVPIKGMYDSVLSELNEKFEGKQFDATEENIQARLRMIVLMAYANKHKYTLLSTSDKSETALGYTTLYGDMSGAISIITDLTKPEVYDLAKWYNAKHGLIIPTSTLSKPPSPELKPGQVAPFDYPKLSPLLERMTNQERMQNLLKDYPIEDVRAMYRKWRGNEFKRYQAPIALKCKPTAFGMGRQYPITNQYVPRALLEP